MTKEKSVGIIRLAMRSPPSKMTLQPYRMASRDKVGTDNATTLEAYAVLEA